MTPFSLIADQYHHHHPNNSLPCHQPPSHAPPSFRPHPINRTNETEQERPLVKIGCNINIHPTKKKKKSVAKGIVRERIDVAFQTHRNVSIHPYSMSLGMFQQCNPEHTSASWPWPTSKSFQSFHLLVRRRKRSKNRRKWNDLRGIKNGYPCVPY